MIRKLISFQGLFLFYIYKNIEYCRRCIGTPSYNGNISSLTWKAGSETTLRGYKFAYDGLDRLTSATYGEGSSIDTNANRFTEKVTGYDRNGNILGLQRYGQTGAGSYGLVDNLTCTLEGNRLTRVDDAVSAAAYNDGFEFKDAVKQANEYAYDANGNLTKDLNKNISNIQYNFLNLKKIGCTSTKVNKSKLLLPFVFGLHYLCPAKSRSVTAVPSPTHTPPTARSCARCISQAVRPPPWTIAAT